MKAIGAIVALSGKIAKNKKPYTVIELENGEKIWCWNENKLVGFSMGDLVEIEASDEQYPRLMSIKKSTIAQQQELPRQPAPVAVPLNHPALPSIEYSTCLAEVLHRLENIEMYLSQFDKLYLEKLTLIEEHVSQNAATIQTIAGVTQKASFDFTEFVKNKFEALNAKMLIFATDLHDFMQEQAEKEPAHETET